MSTTILPPGKHIAFDPETGDYAAYYDGQLLGYRPTPDTAQQLADDYARAQLVRANLPVRPEVPHG